MLTEHQSCQLTQQLPPSVITQNDTEWAESGCHNDCSSLLASFSTHHSSSHASTSNKCSAPAGSQGTAQTMKCTWRTKWKLMNTPSFIECINAQLSPAEKTIVKVAGQFHLKDLCTNIPWPATELKKKNPQMLEPSKCSCSTI